jgi:hypothetical protein
MRGSIDHGGLKRSIVMLFTPYWNSRAGWSGVEACHDNKQITRERISEVETKPA